MVFIHHKDCLKESLLKKHGLWLNYNERSLDGGPPAKRSRRSLWSIKACPATLARWFWVLALPLVIGPPNLQNQLTLTSEGALNRKMFRSTFGFLETPQDENRCLHNKENDEERLCLPHWRDHEIRTFLTWRILVKLGVLISQRENSLSWP